MKRSVRLPVTPPFNFPLALRYLRRSPSTIVERIAENACVRPVRIRGRWLLLSVSMGGCPERPGLEAALSGVRVSEADLEAAAALAAELFQTRVDTRPFIRAARRDPRLAALVRTYPGLHLVLIGEPFEALIWAIIGQQVNIAFAGKLKRVLLERYGGRLTVNGGGYRLFPAPERLARAKVADLRSLQFSHQKADYIIGLSRAVVRGDLDLDGVRGLPTEEGIARLTAFKGVGRWTAEYVLLRGLGDRDAIPAADGGLRRIVGDLYGLGRLASEEEVRRIAEALAGWRGYGAFYWWFAIQERAHRSSEA